MIELCVRRHIAKKRRRTSLTLSPQSIKHAIFLIMTKLTSVEARIASLFAISIFSGSLAQILI